MCRECFSGEAALVVDRGECWANTVLLAHLVIFHAVPGSHVYQACSGCRGDEIGRDETGTMILLLEHVGACSIVVLELRAVDAVDDVLHFGALGEERQNVINPVLRKEVFICWLRGVRSM